MNEDYLTNAKEEFLDHIFQSLNGMGVKVKAVRIHRFDRDISYDDIKDNWDDFLALLDFNYDSGYGGQELHGTIWYTDGTWSERGEYDGSEWWEYKKCPEIG